MKKFKKIGIIGLISVGTIFCGQKSVFAQTVVTSESELTSCIASSVETKCVLGDDISLNDALHLEGKDKIIDLNGYTLTSIKSIEVKSVKLTIEDSNKTGKYICKNDYGIFAYNNGTVIVNSGTLESKDGVLTGNNTLGDMNFEVNGGTLTSSQGAAIYMPGQVNLKITGGTINGGINIRMGQVTISGGTINNTNKENTDTIEKYYKWNGSVWYGDAITIMAGTYNSENTIYGNSLNLNITGGTINSSMGNALNVYSLGKVSQNVNINVSGGTFTGINESLNVRDMTKENIDETYKAINNKIYLNVTGGTFNHSIKSYLNSNYIENESNKLFIVKENKNLDAIDKDGNTLVKFESEKLLPNNYKLIVTKDELKDDIKENITKDVTSKIKTLLDTKTDIKDTKIIDVFDINVKDNNNVVKIEGTDSYKISLKVNESLKDTYKYFKIVYIENNEIKDVMDAKLVDGYIVFNTTHLSSYGIVGYNTKEIVEETKKDETKVEETKKDETKVEETKKDENNNIENPKTFDNIIKTTLLLTLVTILSIITIKKKNKLL